MAIKKGNAGEWSEPYVLLSLLADGRIYNADKDLNIISDVWHDITSIIFKEDSGDKDGSLKYVINPDGQTVSAYRGDELLTTISRDKCRIYSEGLRKAIKNSHNSHGTIDIDPEYSAFLESIGRKTLKASSKSTPDIWLNLPDVRNTSNKPLGFSIKSRMGSPPTLFNSSSGSNMYYEITGEVTEESVGQLLQLAHYKEDIEEDGSDNSCWYPDYAARIELFKDLGLGLRFIEAATIKGDKIGGIKKGIKKPFQRNLILADYCMPQILADMTAEAYFNGVQNLADLVKLLNEKDRFGVDPSDEYPFYRKKVQDLLVVMATSMTAVKPWDGTEGSNGGFIIVKEDGTLACYHIFDRDDFRDFLLENMKFDTPDNSRYYSTGIIQEDGKYCMSLNVQIRMDQKKSSKSKRQLKGYYDLDLGEFAEVKTGELEN